MVWIFKSYLSLFYGGLLSQVMGVIIGLIIISTFYSCIISIIDFFKKKSNPEAPKEEEVEEELGGVAREDLVIQSLEACGMIFKINSNKANTGINSITLKTLNDNFRWLKNSEGFEIKVPIGYVPNTPKLTNDLIQLSAKELPHAFGVRKLIPYECFVWKNKITEKDIDNLKALYELQREVYPFEKKKRKNKIYMTEEEERELRKILLKYNERPEAKAVRDFLSQGMYYGKITASCETSPKGWIVYTYNTDKKQQEYEHQMALQGAGLYFERLVKNSDPIITYPIIERSEDGDFLIFKNADNETLIFDDKTKAKVFNYFDLQYDVECLSVDKYYIENNGVREHKGWKVVISKPRKDLIFAKPNSSIYKSIPTGKFIVNSKGEKNEVKKLELDPVMYDKLEDIIKKSVELSLDDYGRKEHLFMGEVIDPTIVQNDRFQYKKGENGSQIFASMEDLKHVMVAGGTGSGKTQTALSLLYIWSRICKELEDDCLMFFADGKGSQDFDIASKYLSKYPKAQRSSNGDTLIELANQLSKVWSIYQERVKLFQASNCKDIYAYRASGKKMPRVFLVIDEFKGFKSEMGDFNKPQKNSVVDMLMKLAAEARYTGITLFFISQGVKDETYPNALKNNLTTKILLKLDETSANYYTTGYQVMNLKKGTWVFQIDDWTNENPASRTNWGMGQAPFMGEGEAVESILAKNYPVQEHTPFEYDLLYNSGKSDSDIFSDSLGINAIAKFVKKRFFEQEGWEIVEVITNPEQVNSFIVGFVMKKGTITVACCFVEDEKRIGKFFFASSPKFAQVEAKHHPNYYFHFLNFEGIKPNAMTELANASQRDSVFEKSIFIPKAQYLTFLREADNCYHTNEQSFFFSSLFGSLVSDYHKTRKGNTPDGVVVSPSAVSDLSDNPYKDIPKELRTKSHITIGWDFFEYMRGINSDDKGHWFEIFVCKLYDGLGYLTWSVNALLDDPESEFKRNENLTTGDGGGDVIIQNKTTGVRRLIQAKCYLGQPVKKEAYSEVKKVLKFYKCTEMEVITPYNLAMDGFSPSFVNEVNTYHVGEITFGMGNPIPEIASRVKTWQDLPEEERDRPLVLTGYSGLKALINAYLEKEEKEQAFEVSEEDSVNLLLTDENYNSIFLKELKKNKKVKHDEEFARFNLALLKTLVNKIGKGNSYKIDPLNPNYIIGGNMGNMPEEIYLNRFSLNNDINILAIKPFVEKAKASNYKKIVIFSNLRLKKESEDFKELNNYLISNGAIYIGEDDISSLLYKIKTMEEEPVVDEEDGFDEALEDFEEQLNSVDEIVEGFDEEEREDIDDLEIAFEERKEDIQSIGGDDAPDLSFIDDLDDLDMIEVETKVIPQQTIKEDKPLVKESTKSAGRKVKVRSLEEIAIAYAKEKTKGKGAGKLSAKDKKEREDIELDFLNTLKQEAINKKLNLTGYNEIDKMIEAYNNAL